MTEPLSNKSPVERTRVSRRSNRSLIVHHQPIDDYLVAKFAAEMDAELEKFERRFQRWVIRSRDVSPNRP